VTISTLMVHLHLGTPNEGKLRHAVELARVFEAGVIGVAAAEMMQFTYGDGYIPGDLIESNRAMVGEQIRAAEAEFRTAFASHGHFLDWRSGVLLTPLAAYLASEARAADLVILSARSGALADAPSRTSAGELLMQLGRPALVVPEPGGTPRFARVMVAWKDTREARRATFDALPLLRRARSVTLVGVHGREDQGSTHAQLTAVMGWLGRNGVAATIMPLRSDGHDAVQLLRVATELETDVVVAGAYGHSRFREWVLGGVTRDLLAQETRCSLLSH